MIVFANDKQKIQFITMEFKQTVIEALQYYVFCLVDPRDKKIFYIGK